ncbi:MAG TPA: Arc family DNA-binding protein [Vicinamibacteria bacterium]|nr:Arc family DNA-binding protein [Vicinamibacteria bacterium]
MASISVRRIDDEVYELLRIRAAKHGVSMEEEVRQILRRAVSAPERLGDLALEYFGEDGVDLELPPRGPHEPMSVDE